MILPEKAIFKKRHPAITVKIFACWNAFDEKIFSYS